MAELASSVESRRRVRFWHFSLPSGLGLYIVLVVFFGFLASLVTAYFLIASGKLHMRLLGTGLGTDMTLETLIIGLGVLIMFFFLSGLPLMMAIGYRTTRQTVLERKIREDLWLCGLDDQQLGTRMDEVRLRNSRGAFALPVFVNLAFLFVMWSVVIMPGGLTDTAYSFQGRDLGDGYYAPDINGFFGYVSARASIISWAFLGSYFYTLQILIRRWLRSDMTTGVLWMINVRVAVALVVGLLLMEIPADIPKYITFIIAFIAGIVPDAVLRWLTERMKKAINLEGEGISVGNVFKPSDLQESIDGLSFWQVERLHEEGIESVQDLAMKEIPDLLINVRFDTPHLLYWVDQALLCSQAGEEKVDLFKNASIKTASDLFDMKEKNELDQVYQAIQDAQGQPPAAPSANGAGGQSGTRLTPVMLKTIVGALESGPNLAYVREYWKNTRTPRERATRLAEMSTQPAGQRASARETSPEPQPQVTVG